MIYIPPSSERQARAGILRSEDEIARPDETGYSSGPSEDKRRSASVAGQGTLSRDDPACSRGFLNPPRPRVSLATSGISSLPREEAKGQGRWGEGGWKDGREGEEEEGAAEMDPRFAFTLRSPKLIRRESNLG